jgi:hypothetical protein
MSIAFNGSNQYLNYQVGQIGSLTYGDAYSMCGWFKPTSTASAYGLMMGVNPADHNTTYSGILTWTSSDFRGMYNGSRGAQFGTRSASGWVYCAYSCDASGNATSATAQTGLTSGSSFATDANSNGATASFNGFVIGREATSNYLAGEACCVRIFSAALTTTQFYNEAISPTPVLGSCVANWRLATNSDLTDTVYSYALTAFNSPSTGSTEPTELTASTVVPGIWLSRQNRAFGSARQRYT